VALSALAEEIIAEMRRLEPQRQVEVDIQPGLAVNGDSNLLRLVLENLLSNAWKFTSRCEQAVIEFGRQGMDGQAAFYVSDNGIGFDMRFANQLFRDFQRLHSADEFPGSGVGLANVKRIIQRHGGRVWAVGRTGEGATIYFTLPE
jgi:light-regulated signal transduction histidine kinase (bacteriophytochrome)